MLTQKTFEGSAVSLSYREGPASGPALLLLHGLTQRWQAFLPLLPQVLLTHHVFAIDLRGHGLSGHVKDGYRGEDYGRDVIEFLEQVIKEPVIVFGHSLGGMVGIYVAGCLPQMVRALIVGDSSLFRQNTNRAVYLEMFQKTLALLERRLDGETLSRELGEMTLHSPVYGEIQMKSLPNTDEAYLAAWASSLSHMDPAALAMTLDGRASENWRPKEFLQRVQCPTLLLQADPKVGGLMTDEDVAGARTLLRHSLRVQIKGVGHSLQMSDAAPIGRVVGNFLASLE